MSFLQPVLLALGVLISVPFIIHLFGELSHRPYSFSSLKFLREIEQESLQKLQFRQWLILLARALWIASLVGALANPFIAAMGGLLKPGVLLIDRSFSTREDPVFEIAAERFIAEYPRWSVLEYDENSSPDTLKRRLLELRDPRELPNLIMLSDFQDNRLTQRITATVKELFHSPVFISLTKSGGNSAVSSVRLLPNSGIDDEAFELGIRVASNRHREDPPSVLVSVNGRQSGRVSLSADGDGQFRFDPGDKEYAHCVIRTADDDYPGDNVRYLTLRPLSRIKVLCLSDSPGAGYHINALKAMGRLETTVAAPDELFTYDLQDFDLIWLSDLYELPAGQQRALLNFAETKPLVLVAGIGSPESGGWDAVTGDIVPENGQEGFLTIADLCAVPGLSAILPNEFRIFRYHTSDLPDMQPLWRLSNGDTFLGQPASHIFFFMAPFHFDWNAMGLSPYFTRAMGNFISLALQDDDLQYLTGETIRLPQSQFSVITPAGERHRVQGAFGETQTPGIYSLESTDLRRDVAVNIPEEETVQDDMLPDSVRVLFWNAMTFRDIDRAVKGRNAQTLFYCLAAIFIMLEMMLLRKGEKTLS
ncbi:MAG: BatA domain-containing protein [Candidatus Marinimicrobia bacterium]|nr:BatA domain-containing protein [Candidatus Neomarinimicrobiota bacterium]